MAGALAADDGCTVAVVTSQPFLLHHAAVGGLSGGGGAPHGRGRFKCGQNAPDSCAPLIYIVE